MSYLPLKGFETVFDSTLNNDIQDGIIEYFDWALLDKGNYFNVTIGELSPSGQDYSRLRLSNNESFALGKVWEGFRKNWVWQSGISYNPQPIVGVNNTKPGISGVYINGAFYPSTTTGPYAHHVDYYNGRVIFDSPISTGLIVQAEFSYKWINIIYPDSVPWLRQIQTKSLEPDSNFLEQNKGPGNIPSDARIQLPAIVVEIVPVRKFKGYQLGGGQWIYTDVIFHCLAEDEHTRNKLVDIVSLQENKTINLFNSNKINQNGEFPLDYRGVPVSGALIYPQLVEKYNGGKITFTGTTVSDMTVISTNIYGGVVRVTTEGVKTDI